LQNDENLGFRGNFYLLFHECSTDYLLVVSDEDLVMVERLDALVNFLWERKPSLVVPQYFLGDPPLTPYRGCHKRIADVQPEEYFIASSHLPGLVFDLEKSRIVIQKLGAFLSLAGFRCYPQLPLVAGILVSETANSPGSGLSFFLQGVRLRARQDPFGWISRARFTT
jgi:hypothetical protein